MWNHVHNVRVPARLLSHIRVYIDFKNCCVLITLYQPGMHCTPSWSYTLWFCVCMSVSLFICLYICERLYTQVKFPQPSIAHIWSCYFITMATIVSFSDFIVVSLHIERRHWRHLALELVCERTRATLAAWTMSSKNWIRYLAINCCWLMQ